MKFNKEDVIKNKKKALHKIDSYLNSLMDSKKIGDLGKANKLSFWINDWVRYLDCENEFTPKKLKRYKHGEVIKVNLGFNLGSEEGGLHYAVVLERKNSVNSGVITVAPLTSVKPSTNLDKLFPGSIYLGTNFHDALVNKRDEFKLSNKTKSENINNKLEAILETLNSNTSNTDIILKSKQNIDAIKEAVENLEKELNLIKNMEKEISKMKEGSIILLSQITTISKMRIYDPKRSDDILANIKLTNENLDLIDTELIKILTNRKLKK